MPFTVNTETNFYIAMKHWKEYTSNEKVHITPLMIILYSIYKTKGSCKKLTHELKKHFANQRSVQKHCFKMIKAINDYELGIEYINVMKGRSSLIKEFHQANSIFSGEHDKIILNHDDFHIIKINLSCVIKNLD